MRYYQLNIERFYDVKFEKMRNYYHVKKIYRTFTCFSAAGRKAC